MLTSALNKTVYWTSSDPNVASVDRTSGLICTKLAGSTVITAETADGGYTAQCTLTVNQVLTGADTYITDQNIRSAIINAKNMSDIAQNLYLSGTITYSQKQLLQDRCQYAADIARADHIVVNDQSDFAYQHFKGRNKVNGDVSPFNRDLQLGSEYTPGNANTIDVLVVQRGMQAVGWFEPAEDYEYGTFDQETYEAAASAPKQLLTGSKFDQASYRVLFQASTAEFRTPQWLIDLQEYSRQHRITQLAVAAQALAEIEVPIKGGGPSGVHAGRADVLRDRGSYSEIWEIKHENPANLQVGNAQLQRYTDAGKAYEQSFAKPLDRGYDISTFYVPYTATTCLEVKSTSVAGLIFYNEIPIPTPRPSFVLAPFPEAQKEYVYQLKPIPLGDVVAVGVAIVCIAGGIYLLLTTGDLVPLEESIRNLRRALGYA